MIQNTAILVFAQTAAIASQHKAIHGGNELFSTLNKQIIYTVQKTGIPYFISDESVQEGDTFGNRFVHAIEQVFKAGYDRVITIGNDTPHLRAAHIEKAAQRLQEQSLVLGPSLDGGFYLMGLDRSFFDKEAFLNLPWQSSRLRQALVQQCTPFGKNSIVLPALADIDNYEDLYTIKKFLFTLSRKLKHLILDLTRLNLGSISFKENHIESHSLAIPSNKGSPFLLAA